MSRTFDDLEIGSTVFIGSRWHRVTDKRPADPNAAYYRYKTDRVMTGCDGWTGFNATKANVNIVSKDPAPLCKNCFPDKGRNAIPLSAITDPEIREKVRSAIAKGTRYRWTFYLDATE